MRIGRVLIFQGRQHITEKEHAKVVDAAFYFSFAQCTVIIAVIIWIVTQRSPTVTENRCVTPRNNSYERDYPSPLLTQNRPD